MTGVYGQISGCQSVGKREGSMSRTFADVGSGCNGSLGSFKANWDEK